MPPAKLVTFATAPDQITAEMWRDLVRQAGVDCALQPGDMIGFIGVTAAPVRLITRPRDADRARRALDAQLGRRQREPEDERGGEGLRDLRERGGFFL